MEARDLELLEAGLREACVTHDLQWVINAIDEHVRDGKHVVLREPEGLTDASWGFSIRQKPRPDVPDLRRYDLGPQERVLALIDAMISVYEELPAVAAATMENLNQGWEGRVTLVETLVFTEDQDDAPVIRVDGTGDDPARAAVVSQLRRIREQVTAND